MIWKIQDRTFTFDREGWIMGVLNVTPDSFSDGGQFTDVESALSRARQMIAEGAKIIDIGGESSRPGAQPVSEKEEMERVLPVIGSLRGVSEVLISIDTCKPRVARAALETGANIINDIAGFRDPAMLEVIAQTGASAVCMHMQGTPGDMQRSPVYSDLVAEVRGFFAERAGACLAAGIDLDRIIFDPGIGFGKTVAHNLALLRNLPLLRVKNRPILVGVSRKSFLGKVVGDDSPSSQSNRFWPTVALTAWLREEGAEILRVHDVLPNAQALKMIDAIHG